MNNLRQDENKDSTAIEPKAGRDETGGVWESKDVANACIVRVAMCH
jgi:hypothetical protein